MLLLITVVFTSCNNDDDEPQNHEPVLLDTTINLQNPTSDLITTLSATDEDGDDLTYTIVSQTPIGSVIINETTGEVFIADASAFNQTNTITVTINISDGIDITTMVLTINVTIVG